jgi:ribosomal protein L7/L12
MTYRKSAAERVMFKGTYRIEALKAIRNIFYGITLKSAKDLVE